MSPETFAAMCQPTGCLIWTGAQTSKGYGSLRFGGVETYAHRVAWELAHGLIPDDLTIEHRCRVRCCVNVEHMELVTRAENSRLQAAHRRGLADTG